MEKYLTAQYWFGNPVPPAITLADKTVFWVSLVVFVVGFALVIYKTRVKDKGKKYLISRIYTLLLTIGLLGMIWFGLRDQLIKMFGVRIVPILIYLVGLWWAWMLWKYYKNVYLRDKYLAEQEQLKSKYL